MTTHHTSTASLLDAGAILLPGSTDREDADVLTARTYTHPALGGRPVVRLVQGTLGEAEDLAMEFLGLTRPVAAPEVGQVRRETLGFPAWALVNDPVNGHHALALVKDIERLARMAGSRTGAAKDGFESLADRLSRAVPHFLPTYYEQVARIWLQHDNPTWAGMFFGKARAAERAHGLAVDEERQRAVFLEFAFAGALTVKALKEHAHDLAERLDPVDAWSQFRRLIVERCEAGLPPHATLSRDARSLLKVTGLDRAEEERTLVADLIVSPAVLRAPASFWFDYRATLAELGRRDPAVRARLLEILPAVVGRDVAADENWLTLLADSGAESLLTGAPTDPPLPGGITPADWLSRWERHRHHGKAPDHSSATLALVERMAPRLLADDRPVNLFTGHQPARADLDLLDLCLAAGVPLAAPCDHCSVRLPLDHWLNEPRTGARDLAAVAADRRFRPLLHDALGLLNLYVLPPSTLDALADHPALGPVLHDWLADRAAEFVGATGLPGSRAALSELRRFHQVAARVNPDAVAAVAAHDFAPLLLRTLRTGIYDELCWPALEEAIHRIGEIDENKDWFIVAEAWPALILARKEKAIVVGPDRILLEHDLRVPMNTSSSRMEFRWVDDQLLVNWFPFTENAYWSGRPDQVISLEGVPEIVPSHRRYRFEVDAPSLPLPGGGRATGVAVLRAGDTVLPAARPLLSDGTGHWARVVRDNHETYWVEHDPLTGTDGPASLPAFLRSGIDEGTALVPEHCELLPLLPGLESSPFGTDGSVLGRWVRKSGKGPQGITTAGTPDGRITSLPFGTDGGWSPVTLGALRLPGGSGPVAARVSRSVTLYAADSGTTGALGTVLLEKPGGEFAAGTRFVPPAQFWHALVPRDERGSLALRALTTERATALLSASAEALAAQRAEEVSSQSRLLQQYTGPSPSEVGQAAVARSLPELSHPSLLAGVASIVRGVVAHAADTAEFAASTQPPEAPPQHVRGMFPDYEPEHGADQALSHAVTGIAGTEYGWYRSGRGWAVLRQIRAVNHVLSAKPADGLALPEPEVLSNLTDGWTSDARTVPVASSEWIGCLDVPSALAWRATSQGTSPEKREALLLLLGAIAEGPLADPGSPLREVVLCEPKNIGQRAGQVLRHGDRTVVILCEEGETAAEKQWFALDHDPSGEFGAVAHFTARKERRHIPDLPAYRIAALTGLVREQGPAPWRPAAVNELVAATGLDLGPIQATLLLGGLPSEGYQKPASAAQLTSIGLNARQAELGERMLRPVGQGTRVAVLTALLPEDAELLWTDGPDVTAAARVWSDALGGLVRVPEEVGDILGGPSVEALLNPSRVPWLNRTTTMRLDKDGKLAPADPSAIPSPHFCHTAASDLAILGYGLPYGHPLRAALAAGLEALRHRLSDPGLLLDLSVHRTNSGGSTAALIRKAHGMPETGGAGPDGLTRVGEAVVLHPLPGDKEMTLVRPAGLTGCDDPVLDLLDDLSNQERFPLDGVRTVLGDDLAGLVAVGHGPGTPHGWAQDPDVSAPDLVTEVASALGLGADAAAHYLQLLALPDPTDRNCARWTGWKPARLKKARAELAATDLVIEAKRSRAGRTLFLPGAWTVQRHTLPIENWKERFYPLSEYRQVVPKVSVAELFTRAWSAVRDGEGPAFEELTTRATGKDDRR
ncbi:hypothetical protein ACIA6D_42925 [Streptomyces cacaoi]